MKAILVMDMSADCCACQFNKHTHVCRLTKKSCMAYNHEMGLRGRPDWCPLKEINSNMIKALRCVASQDAFKDCHRTRYNRDRKEGEPLMTCKPLPDDLSIPCPYQQDEYKTNCEDGECMGWLNEIADMLEGK